MLTRDDARKLASKVLGFSTFSDCHVTISASEQAYTRFANNGITTASLALRQTVSIHATRNNRTGVSSTNDLDDASLRKAVKLAEELAGIAPPNPEWQPPVGAQEFPSTSDFDQSTATARSPEMIPHVKRIIDASLAQKLVAAGLILRTHNITTVANKAGLFGFHNASDSQLTTTIRTPDGSSSGWAGAPSTQLARIDSEKLAATAIEKCLRWKNPQRLDPGNYTVVLEPTAAGDLVRLMAPAFSARLSEEGRTFLSKAGGGTLLGEKSFPEFITLRTDPFDPRQPSSPWTADFLPTRPVTWIDKGTVAKLAYDRYWAERTGNPATPNPAGAESSLVLEGTDATLDELIASVDRGLLITHFWYIRFVNPQTLQQTGLTRDGLFLIENGKITTPVMNFRFNESPVRMLRNARRIGTSVRMRGLEGGMMIAPSIVATDFPLTSISDAV